MMIKINFIESLGGHVLQIIISQNFTSFELLKNMYVTESYY